MRVTVRTAPGEATSLSSAGLLGAQLNRLFLAAGRTSGWLLGRKPLLPACGTSASVITQVRPFGESHESQKYQQLFHAASIQISPHRPMLDLSGNRGCLSAPDAVVIENDPDYGDVTFWDLFSPEDWLSETCD